MAVYPANWPGAQAELDRSAVLGEPHDPMLGKALTIHGSVPQPDVFIHSIRRDCRERVPEYLSRRPTEQVLCRRIPEQHGAVGGDNHRRHGRVAKNMAKKE